MEGQYRNKDRGIVMSDLKRFQEFVKWFEELVFGVEEKPKRARTKLINI